MWGAAGENCEETWDESQMAEMNHHPYCCAVARNERVAPGGLLAQGKR
jgi:hypothetical protein